MPLKVSLQAIPAILTLLAAATYPAEVFLTVADLSLSDVLCQKGYWGSIHVDFVSPFSFVRTFLRFTLTFVSYFPRSVCEVKKIGIYVDMLAKIWYSRRLCKIFLKNFVLVYGNVT